MIIILCDLEVKDSWSQDSRKEEPTNNDTSGDYADYPGEENKPAIGASVRDIGGIILNLLTRPITGADIILINILDQGLNFLWGWIFMELCLEFINNAPDEGTKINRRKWDGEAIIRNSTNNANINLDITLVGT
jgi:hypothetical protein